MNAPLGAMDVSQLLALAAALGWASGLRLYAVVFIAGAAGYLGWLPLPEGLKLLQHPVVLAASLVMLLVEFVADKIPGLDSLWDALHTFIRIPAGAALAAAVFGGDSSVWTWVAALMGGTLAATSHAAKTTTRAAVNTSPEPFSNIALSLAGDAFVPGLFWLAVAHPLWFWPVLVGALVLAVVLIVWLFGFLRGLLRRLRGRGAATALALAAASVLVGWPPPVPAQPSGPAGPSGRPERIAADLHEEVHRIRVSAADLFGRRESRIIRVTVFRPGGIGPFVPVVVSHGRSGATRLAAPRQRFEPLARYLVSKGFAVVVPTRIGYGEEADAFDPEDPGPCRTMRFDSMAAAAGDQVLAALAFARTLPEIDPKRWLALGQSVGGLATLAVAARKPEGLVAAINFSGGSGGNPELRPGRPCGVATLARMWRQQAATAAVPTLWLYWSHDRYWGDAHPREWVEAWREGGGKAQFHQLPPWAAEPADGHDGIGRAMDQWVPIAERFFADLGFMASGLPVLPEASGYAALEDVERVPVSQLARQEHYTEFLKARPPRAFAIGSEGAVGWASGDWAIGRALGACQWRRGEPCVLYAVNRDVVWNPASSGR